MILGVGTDIVEVSRVKKAIANPRFCERVYTEAERRYCESRGMQRAQSYAARFSGKEAILKAFGTGLREGTMQEIEILPDELGCPQVKLTGQFARLADEKKVEKVWISLSHTKEYATAQCVMEGKK
ncbi:holo-[acyl-carrier protein] synthase [Selenomonas sp. WCT3]|uniref:holo-ACP synthase n=1 Tax=unclassified Selenomonas TaxID=2637378 RepID=UPI000880CEE3|nr:holo-ACP synthase [Selenomonas sp.]MCR5439531.1 holo-ACP synthase [Selenomonas sp.]SDG48300.1 holo-[acyl-carrier protein] synthase [Selenomonas ruminantium]